MAENSLLWETNNTGDGVTAGYTDDQMFQLFRSFCPTTNQGGVASDVLNELAVTGTATPVSVASGQALVYGIPYYNTASVTVAISTPAVSTRVDRIVLRASWAAQTVRITRIAGTEGAGTPAMTQTAGTTWDIPLATVSITTGAVITVTDAREWIGGVGDGTITAAKLANYIIDPRTHISGTNGIVIDPQNGDARGTDAVDLQTLRSNVAMVASGANASITGGEDNKATAAHATVGGGKTNLASDVYATVAGGTGNTASADDAFVGGGTINTASGDDSVIVGGSSNTATAIWATVGGGFDSDATGTGATVVGGRKNLASGQYSIAEGYYSVANKFGQHAHAANRFAADGDAQTSRMVAFISTSNATPAELFLSGASNRMTIASDTTWAFRILIVARRTDADNESAAYECVGCIDNNAGTTALVGTVTKTVVAEDTVAWDVAVTADNTNDALVITVTGETSKTIRWVATVWTTEVTG